MYFNQSMRNGTYIGYHVEGGDNFVQRGSIPLSMESLTDDTLLFMCNNPIEWFPFHLNDANNYTVYEIEFTLPSGILVCNQYLYNQTVLFNGRHLYTKAVPEYVDLIVLPNVGENAELTEAALRNPTKYVKSIERYTTLSTTVSSILELGTKHV